VDSRSSRFEFRDQRIVAITADHLIMNSVYVNLMLG
jgi:hypothetical protein